MRFDEYRKHDAVALAGRIAKREVSAKEVLETAITRAEQVNPPINAIVHKQYEQARKAIAAGLPDGPLKGVVATENRIRDGADAAMGYPRFAMLDLLKLLSGLLVGLFRSHAAREAETAFLRQQLVFLKRPPPP